MAKRGASLSLTVNTHTKSIKNAANWKKCVSYLCYPHEYIIFSLPSSLPSFLPLSPSCSLSPSLRCTSLSISPISFLSSLQYFLSSKHSFLSPLSHTQECTHTWVHDVQNVHIQTHSHAGIINGLIPNNCCPLHRVYHHNTPA